MVETEGDNQNPVLYSVYHIFQFIILTRLAYTNVKQRTDVNFALRHATCLHLTSSNDQRLVPGIITSLRSKYVTFRLSSRQVDNQLA